MTAYQFLAHKLACKLKNVKLKKKKKAILQMTCSFLFECKKKDIIIFLLLPSENWVKCEKFITATWQVAPSPPTWRGLANYLKNCKRATLNVCSCNNENLNDLSSRSCLRKTTYFFQKVIFHDEAKMKHMVFMTFTVLFLKIKTSCNTTPLKVWLTTLHSNQLFLKSKIVAFTMSCTNREVL